MADRLMRIQLMLGRVGAFVILGRLAEKGRAAKLSGAVLEGRAEVIKEARESSTTA